MDNIINTAVFKVADTACFIWHHLDDAHIIYDKRSGHSQALNGFACEIFEIISDKPSSLFDIMAEVKIIMEKPLEDTMKEQILRTVTEFDKMGLIEPTNSGN